MKSIRFYLIVVLLSTICLVNFVAALNGYQSSIEAGDKILDDRLIDMSHTVARMTSGTNRLPANAFAVNSVFQVWRGEQILTRSENSPLRLLAPLRNGFHIVNSNDVQWRTYVHQQSPNGNWVIYGERNDLFRRLIDQLAMASILPIIWVLPIIGLLVWLIVGYGLKPLISLAGMLRSRGANELKPIKDENFPEELSTLVGSTNKLFARLSEAFDREQKFAADAAHELRTPLAALKISLHNHAQENQLSGDSFAALEASAKRMESSIEQILTLYRLSPENFQHTIKPCQIRSLIQQTVIELYAALQQKNQHFELFGGELEIEADASALSILLKNLLDNAIKYTPQDGDITISIMSGLDDQLQIAVEDSGPGVPEQDYYRVFDRFYRVGQDRHDSGVVGSGIGLSIVRHVVKLHHGSIKLSKSTSLGGLSVLVTLPKSQSDIPGTML